MHKYIELEEITFEEFIGIYEQIIKNINKIREGEDENDYLYGLPRLSSYYYARLAENIKNGAINDKSFRDRYDVESVITHWNYEPYGRNYEKLLKKYQKIACGPNSVKLLQRLMDEAEIYYGTNFRNTKRSLRQDKFLSFWNWHIAYSDTKGSWRHWWDAVNNDPVFKIGDMEELRTNAGNNHIFQMQKHWADPNYKYLKHCSTSLVRSIKSKVFVILQYDKYKPLRTYSYKKSQGSHRMVTILPIGSTEIYHVPEQFLKTSRKKAIKDAKK